MPSDIIGSAVLDAASGEFTIRRGPVFANVLLADEINRTPPKTQSALLEAMEERQVSIYGQSLALPDPFFVIATQNPIEYEGTYPLPEAQLDRFLMQIELGYPDAAAELQMLHGHQRRWPDLLPRLAPSLTPAALAEAIRQTGHIQAEPPLLQYIVDLVRASRQAAGVLLGASPRAATALLDAARAAAWLDGRTYAIPDDVLAVVHAVLRHRLVANPNSELEGIHGDAVVDRVVEAVAIPR